MIIAMLNKAVFRFLPDKMYLAMLFKRKMGYWPNIDNPQTYNEKLQWLKLHDRNPLYTKMADKYASRKFLEEKIGKGFTIPLIGVWECVDDIDFEKLPNQFVLKCTHDSGGTVLCLDKTKLDIAAAKKKLRGCLKRNYFRMSREWPYKNIAPRIIAEEYVVDESGYELKDYKFYCFSGVPQFLLIATDRNAPGKDVKFDFFDMDFNHLAFTRGHENSKRPIQKPHTFEEMKAIVAELSKGIPHVRVDLYSVNGKVYVGEFTFFPSGGVKPFKPDKWDRIFGDCITLPKK